MTYKNIEKFLNDKPEIYDFSNDGASEEYEKMEGVEKYFNYKAVMDTAFVNLICVKDTDSGSELLQKVYSVLWHKEMLEEFCLNKQKNRYQGETLNSVQTTFNKMYEFYHKPSHELQRKEIVKKKIHNKQDISIKYMYTRYFCGIEEYKEDFSFAGVDFLEFLKIYHALGNFMPVPVGCNAPRGTGAVHDYWDLTLLKIYKYYKENNDKYIKSIIGEKEELAVRYRKWLDCFGNDKMGWNNFVKANYLQAFVDENDEPKELWEGHFKQWEADNYSANAALPQAKGQCADYFSNATKSIKARTKTMIDELKKKMEIKESEA